MATIKEKFDGLRQHFTADARTYDCTYTVNGVAAQTDFPATFLWQCKGLSDPFARIVGIGNTVQIGPDRFEITVNYSTSPADTAQKQSQKDPPANPLARPVVRRWGTGYVERLEDHDLDNKLYMASNDEPYPDGLPIRFPYLILSYQRNEASFNETSCLASIWRMDSTKKILCTKFDGSETLEENEIPYVQVSYEFWKLDSGGTLTWDVVKLDAGTYSLGNGAPPKRVYPKDEDGTKALVTGAVVLDGNGHLGDKATPVWNTFRVNGIASLSNLQLPGI